MHNGFIANSMLLFEFPVKSFSCINSALEKYKTDAETLFCITTEKLKNRKKGNP